MMRFRASLPVCAVLLLLLATGCSDDDGDEPEPRRVPLGVGVESRGLATTDPLLVGAYTDFAQGEFPIASLQLDWGAIESRFLNYDWTSLDQHVRQAEIYDVELSVAITILENEVRGSLPVDLRGQWIDGVNFRIRFARFATALLDRARGRVRYLWIGREADVYLSTHSEERDDFRILLAACRDSVALADPDCAVGTSFAYSEAREGEWLEELRPIAEAGDVVGLTIYGRDRRFQQVFDEEGTLALAKEAVAEFPGSRVVLTELGFPRAGGDYAQQLEFARRLTAWLDDSPADLELAIWAQLYDAHPAESNERAQRLFPEDPERAQAYRTQIEALGLRGPTGVITPTWLHVAEWSVTRSVPLASRS
jgi:hypothetical protein